MDTTREHLEATLTDAGARFRPVSVALQAAAAIAFTVAAVVHDNELYIVAAACFWIGTAVQSYLLGRAARR
jgi:hypothetical protein